MHCNRNVTNAKNDDAKKVGIMSKRTKRMVENLRRVVTRDIINPRFVVRNLLALIVAFSLVAVLAGGAIYFKDARKEAKAEQTAKADVPVKLALDTPSMMKKDMPDDLAAELDANAKADVAAKEKEVIAAAESEFASKAVAKDIVYIYKEGKDGAEVVGIMDKGAVADILTKKGEWLKISSGDVTGFVKESETLSGKEGYELAQQYYEVVAVVNEDGINVRVEASEDSDIFEVAYTDDKYDVDKSKTDKNWVCVNTWLDSEAYISKDYVTISEGYRVARASETTISVKKKAKAEMEIEEKTTEDSEDESEEDTEEEEKTTTTSSATTTTRATTTEEEVTEETTTEETTTEEVTTTEAPQSTEPVITDSGAVSLSEDDIRLMAVVMTLECGNQPYDGQVAVANVILNRLRLGYYGSTISDVVYAPYQFSVVGTSSFYYYLENGPFESCVAAAREACAGTNYVKDYIAFRPTWAIDTSALDEYIQIGNHIFYRGY